MGIHNAFLPGVQLRSSTVYRIMAGAHRQVLTSRDQAGRRRTLMNRVLLVYKALGRILDKPQSFGLGERMPQPFVEALSTMRRCLREELAEENQQSSRDWLSCELSQDADYRTPSKTGSLVKRP
jgi:hypothetical protein